jgi:hypothetical protein
MTDQLDLFAQAEALKARGQALADSSQPLAWKNNVDAVIAMLARQGEPFTSDDVSALTGDSPTGSRGAMGARFSHAAKKGIIRRCGYTPSRRAAVHMHPVSLWIGAQQVAA